LQENERFDAHKEILEKAMKEETGDSWVRLMQMFLGHLAPLCQKDRVSIWKWLYTLIEKGDEDLRGSSKKSH